MSLHRRCLLALGALPVFLAAVASGPAQDAPSRPVTTNLSPVETRTAEIRPSEVRPAEIRPAEIRPAENKRSPTEFTRTGARRTAIVAAIERVKAAVVNIHSERNLSPGSDHYSLSPSQNRVNGMGTGIIIDPRGYIITNHHVVEDVSVLRIRLADGTTQNASIVARS